ncbi:MAG: PilT/PilU family type 4a pilus ATPase [Elusimicrobia bacterium]|nr:PilT/PilU family type 4a pilus ATPase [Candidatus Obscuribacterium magneticum]
MEYKRLIELMIRDGISDILFKPGSCPLIRVNGQLVQTNLEPLSTAQTEEIARSLLNPQQQTLFMEKLEMDVACTVDGVSRFRVNLYRQKGTIAVALRTIPLNLKSFEELHLPTQTLKKLVAQGHGLILFAGVTGAGKTTTMNAVIHYLNTNYTYNIITIEDPIEYLHTDVKSSISQREVGQDTASFSEALRHVLRQSPDVIAIGEMRDLETMSAALQAAESGHLVLSTIHTIDAVHSVGRIVDSFPPHEQTSIRQQVANVITGVVAQRLVRSVDGNSRYPATEILLGTTFMRRLLAEGRTEEILRLLAQDTYYGMHTFDQDLEHLHAQNLISTQEALNHATNLEDLALKLRGVDRGVWNGKDEPPAPEAAADKGKIIIELPKERPQQQQKKAV